MSRDGDRERLRRSRGGLLLETLLALAILIMVGLLALGVATDATTATEESDRRAAAVELAASRIAEIEAGLVDLDAVGDLQEIGFDDEPIGVDAPRRRFQVEVESSPSSFDGLVRVEVVVREDDEVGGETVELARLVTLVEDGASEASP
ncbi:MAG: hypothetical protein VX672_05970 [Planctomycetota bacterium]|nr:hypothetical protein [Planctomycetota bacterium]